MSRLVFKSKNKNIAYWTYDTDTRESTAIKLTDNTKEVKIKLDNILGAVAFEYKSLGLYAVLHETSTCKIGIFWIKKSDVLKHKDRFIIDENNITIVDSLGYEVLKNNRLILNTKYHKATHYRKYSKRGKSECIFNTTYEEFIQDITQLQTLSKEKAVEPEAKAAEKETEAVEPEAKVVEDGDKEVEPEDKTVEDWDRAAVKKTEAVGDKTEDIDNTDINEDFTDDNTINQTKLEQEQYSNIYQSILKLSKAYDTITIPISEYEKLNKLLLKQLLRNKDLIPMLCISQLKFNRQDKENFVAMLDFTIHKNYVCVTILKEFNNIVIKNREIDYLELNYKKWKQEHSYRYIGKEDSHE